MTKNTTVKGSGASSTKRDYSYLNLNSTTGAFYYRLKQTDFNGKFNYSNLIFNDCNKETNISFNVFPNPSTGQIQLFYNGANHAIPTVNIYNSIGEKVYSSDNLELLIDLSQKPSGVYLIHLTSDSQSLIKRIIIE